MNTARALTAIVLVSLAFALATAAWAQPPHCDDPLDECSQTPCPCMNSCTNPDDVCPEGTVCLPFGFPEVPCTQSICFCENGGWGGSDDCNDACVPPPADICAEPQGPCSDPCPAAESCATDADCGSGLVCRPTGVPGVECVPGYCYCLFNADQWECSEDCVSQCVVDDFVPAASLRSILLLAAALLVAGSVMLRRMNKGGVVPPAGSFLDH